MGSFFQNMTVQHLGIRNYNPDTDYSQMKQILEEGGLFYGPTDASERLAEKVRRDPDSIIVAAINGQIVGTVTLMEDGRMPLIFRLAVRNDQRRHGIGQKLMEVAEKRLKDRGYATVHISVDENNEELKEYYRRRGYEEGNIYRWMYKEVK